MCCTRPILNTLEGSRTPSVFTQRGLWLALVTHVTGGLLQEAFVEFLHPCTGGSQYLDISLRLLTSVYWPNNTTLHPRSGIFLQKEVLIWNRKQEVKDHPLLAFSFNSEQMMAVKTVDRTSLKKTVLQKVSRDSYLHSMSRNMLFWWPPILLCASQSNRPKSVSLTPLMVSTDLPWRPRTSKRPSRFWNTNTILSLGASSQLLEFYFRSLWLKSLNFRTWKRRKEEKEKQVMRSLNSFTSF